MIPSTNNVRYGFGLPEDEEEVENNTSGKKHIKTPITFPPRENLEVFFPLKST
jgi:hypothetical protein